MIFPSDNEFFEMLNHISNSLVEQGNRHLFVVDLIKNLDKFVLPGRRHIIKRFLMTVLKQFSTSESREVHFETFPLWILLAKYSETMDIRKVLDHINHLYDDYLPYYRIYIEELLSNDQIEKAREMLDKCKEKCGLTDEQCAEEFPALKPPMLNDSIKSISLNMSISNFDGCVTIKQLADCYKKNSGFLGLLIGSFLGSQLAKLLADRDSLKLTPESVFVSTLLDPSLTPDALIENCVLKVVESKNSRSNEKTLNGFLNVMGYLLFLDEFEVVETDSGRVPNKIISRRFPDRDIWSNIFFELLNTNADSINWSDIAFNLKQNFVKLASSKKTFWNSAVNEFNKFFQQLSVESC